MPDDFETFQTGLTSPAIAAEVITPADGVALAHVPRALYVGGAGDLRVMMRAGNVVTLAGVQAGMVYPLRVVQVMATGTTATGLVGLR